MRNKSVHLENKMKEVSSLGKGKRWIIGQEDSKAEECMRKKSGRMCL